MKNKILILLSIFIFISCESNECKYDTDCKDNYSCFNSSCIKNEVECNNISDCKSKNLCDETKVCICDFGVCRSNNPCDDNPCMEYSSCNITLEKEPFYECTCNEHFKKFENSCICEDDFHQEGKLCLSDKKEIDCDSSNIPQNSVARIKKVEVLWNKESNSWNKTSNCEWFCNEQFHTEDNINCISNKKEVNCISNTPENATEVLNKKVEVYWVNNKWEEPSICSWSCNDGYIDRGDSICRVSGWSHISRGGMHTCGIKSGDLYCWGNNDNGQLGLGNDYGDLNGCDINKQICNTPQKVGRSYNWDKISVSIKHSCGIKSGELYCWGNNINGELGLGITRSFNTPRRVGSMSNWSHISVSGRSMRDEGYSCGIESGRIFCWGNNTNGKLGLGKSYHDLINEKIPQQVTNNNNWTYLNLGEAHVCTINTNNELFCWGENTQGELGDNSLNNGLTPQTIAGEWSDFGLGWEYTCGIKEGTLFCWGTHMNSVQGRPMVQAPTLTPHKVGLDESENINFKNLFVGRNNSCALKRDNSLYCWGSNGNYELGLGYKTTVEIPIFVGRNWKKIAFGVFHTCGIDMNNKLFCWGSNKKGELGLGDNYGDSDNCLDLLDKKLCKYPQEVIIR